MCFKQPAFVFGLLGVSILLSCGGTNTSSPSTSPSSQILYILNSGSVTAYSIDPITLASTLVEQPVVLVPASASLLQFDPSPDGHFLYGVWSDGQNLQHLSVFRTDSYGVPQVPAVQVLNADSLSQFNMHPSGRFAYMLEVTSANYLYRADIRLFAVEAGGGMLKENPQAQGSYGPAYIWPAFLYGFSPDGSKLYDTSTLITGSVYRQRAINLTTGVLGGDKQLLSVTGTQQVVIGKVIVDQYQNATDASRGYLDIFLNILNPRKAVIHCTSAMLSSCATATNVQLDRSGNYLFLTDPATQAIHVAAIKLSEGKISDTGSFIPMTSQTPGFAFSPDGTIVYALLPTDNSLHFYHFDRTSGSLAEAGTPLPLPLSSGFCPSQYK